MATIVRPTNATLTAALLLVVFSAATIPTTARIPTAVKIPTTITTPTTAKIPTVAKISSTVTTPTAAKISISTASLCSHSMAAALSSSGFSLFANALLSTEISTTAAPQTYLAPPDTALLRRHLDNEMIQSHDSATAGAMSYQTFLTMPHNSVLPTLHNTTTLVVGTAGGRRVSFNDVLVVVPNLYVDESCVIHGVHGPLVPILQEVDRENDVVRPRKEIKRSPVMGPTNHRQANQLTEYKRFIRRRHKPNGFHKINGSSNP